MGFQQGQTDAGVVGDAAAAERGGRQDAPFGGQHFAAGVDGAVVLAVDAGASPAAQEGRFVALLVGVAGDLNGQIVQATATIRSAACCGSL